MRWDLTEMVNFVLKVDFIAQSLLNICDSCQEYLTLATEKWGVIIAFNGHGSMKLAFGIWMIEVQINGVQEHLYTNT